ncbi:Methyltransferase domain-containing protein [Rhizobium sp. RU35A]|uniref:Class I SAM-dependent methyltransferase n=1 Tax=Rhizobium straminoryzae TaxID=1387186 RepID=A0A549T4U9_9HYPH|nr:MULTISPECIES: class I SAM-dependent methyltransferase [Rhizobium]TRL36852.1 class I SAM-dependent methyltransferase [Rhizobium straminoryzae]SIR02848.1 Methyltransferase domain-containing protein [Rhizobium sp. RU35A]
MQTVEQRQRLKESMPQTTLGLHHTEHCRLLPNRSELLLRLPRGGVCAEIGAAYGDFTADILSMNHPAQLHLIDAWDTDRYRIGLEQIRDKFAPRIEQGQLQIHQGLSTVKLQEFPDQFFDWVYIDTNHTFHTTWEELVLSHRKVKKDGRICGHDFCTGNIITPVVYGVVEAVTKFCNDAGWQFEYLTMESHGHFSFCLRRL